MTRSATGGDTVVVKPSNNVYTVLAGIGALVVILGVVVVFMRANTVFPPKGLMDVPENLRR